MNNLAKVIALGGRRLNKALAMHYLFGRQDEPGYCIDSYVHDGANLFLDGIWNAGEGVHSDTLTSWVDLSGNCQPTPLGTGNTVGENCIASDGTLNGRMTVPDVNPIDLTTFTLEVIYKNGSDSKANQVILGRFNKTSYYVNTANNALTTWIGGSAKTVAISLSNANVHTLQLTCVGTSATAWVDGVKTTENYAANAKSTSDPLCLFGNPRTETCFNGSIMAVRIHNRILTDAELAQNYEIDKARFGLTETASMMMLGMPADETSSTVYEEEQTIIDELEVIEDDTI